MGPRPQGRGRAPGSRLRPALQRTVRVEQAARPPAAASAASAADAGLRSLFEEAARVPQPSPQQQADLLQGASSGDEAARDTLLKTKLAMVGRLAGARVDRGLPFGDLVQEGSIGLMAAIDYFQASGRADFDAFALEQVEAQMEAAIKGEAE